MSNVNELNNAIFDLIIQDGDWFLVFVYSSMIQQLMDGDLWFVTTSVVISDLV
jgi:hypothetical protein